GIALRHRPLTRTEHPDGGRPFGLEYGLGPLSHRVERFVPADRRQLAVLVEDAVLLAEKGRRQPVGAVHDLGEKISLDAVQSAIDLGQRIAVGRDDLVILDADHDAATGAAEPAWGL